MLMYHPTIASRVLEIVDLAFNPPRAPTPEVPVEEQPVVEETVVEVEVPVAGIPPVVPASGFRFIQDSEIETASFEEGVEWVEKSEAVGHEEPVVNGHAPEEAPVSAEVRIVSSPLIFIH
jgi:hypothetical protein